MMASSTNRSMYLVRMSTEYLGTYWYTSTSTSTRVHYRSFPPSFSPSSSSFSFLLFFPYVGYLPGTSSYWFSTYTTPQNTNNLHDQVQQYVHYNNVQVQCINIMITRVHQSCQRLETSTTRSISQLICNNMVSSQQQYGVLFYLLFNLTLHNALPVTNISTKYSHCNYY